MEKTKRKHQIGGLVRQGRGYKAKYLGWLIKCQEGKMDPLPCSSSGEGGELSLREPKNFASGGFSSPSSDNHPCTRACSAVR